MRACGRSWSNLRRERLDGVCANGNLRQLTDEKDHNPNLFGVFKGYRMSVCDNFFEVSYPVEKHSHSLYGNKKKKADTVLLK